MEIFTNHLLTEMTMFQMDFIAQGENQQIPSVKQTSLVEYLQQIPDFRRKQGLRYPLPAVLLLSIMSIMSGRCGYRETAAFCKANQKELLRFLHLEKRGCLPSHVTVREVLKGVNLDDVLAAFNDWAAQHASVDKQEWMAIDGKAIASAVTDYSSSCSKFRFISQRVFSQTRSSAAGRQIRK